MSVLLDSSSLNCMYGIDVSQGRGFLFKGMIGNVPSSAAMGRGDLGGSCDGGAGAEGLVVTAARRPLPSTRCLEQGRGETGAGGGWGEGGGFWGEEGEGAGGGDWGGAAAEGGMC
jgi:hypothetical protein